MPTASRCSFRRARPPRPISRSERSILRFQLEPVLVFLEEGAQIVGCIEQADPLLVIECHRETSEAVDADAALFADAEFEAASRSRATLLFEFCDAGQQF